MLISEAFEAYMIEEVKLAGKADKTLKNYRCAINSLLRWTGDIPVELISFNTIAQWKVGMDSVGTQPSSMKTNLGKLRQVLNFCRKRNIQVMDARDIELPKIVRKETVWLETEEIRLMLAEAKSLRDKALVRALFSSGGRVSEVLSLNRDSIRNNKAEVLAKGSKWVTLYFDDATIKALDEYLDTRKDKLPALFISGQYRRITVSRVEQIIHVMSGEAGISKNVTPHVFRHSFATDLLVNGADLRTVQEHLNHTNISTTQVYTHVAKSRKEASYKKHHTVL